MPSFINADGIPQSVSQERRTAALIGQSDLTLRSRNGFAYQTVFNNEPVWVFENDEGDHCYCEFHDLEFIEPAKMAQRKAAEIARQARAVPDGHQSVRKWMQIPAPLVAAFDSSSSAERGQIWADGHFINTQTLLLYDVLCRLSGYDVSQIVDTDVTLIVGQEVFSADTHLEALMKAIAFYLPIERAIGEASNFDLEKRLKELDLFE